MDDLFWRCPKCGYLNTKKLFSEIPLSAIENSKCDTCEKRKKEEEVKKNAKNKIS